jgi:protein TonB
MGPRLIKEVKPKYPESAAGLTGIVTMQAVVLPDGTVGDVQFSKDAPAKGIPAGRYPDIDKEAIRTVRQWRFVPARRDGEPVPVMVEIEMLFAPTTVAK